MTTQAFRRATVFTILLTLLVGAPQIWTTPSAIDAVEEQGLGRQWIRIGLAGVDVAALAEDPRDPSRLHAWVRGCRNFSSLNDHRDPFTVTDDGHMWSGDVIGATLYSPARPQLRPDSVDGLYAMTWQGVSKTTDSGATWWIAAQTQLTYPDRRIASQPTGEYALAVLPGQPNTLYVDAGPDWSDQRYPGYGLQKSIDDGAAWERIGPSVTHPVMAIAVDLLVRSTVYAAADQTGGLED